MQEGKGFTPRRVGGFLLVCPPSYDETCDVRVVITSLLSWGEGSLTDTPEWGFKTVRFISTEPLSPTTKHTLSVGLQERD